MPGNLCEHCVGYCCRHIALPIEKPTKRSDFEDIRWYLLHGGVAVFVEDGDWYLHIETTCQHLQPDFRCGIYETRPQICRDYSTDNCDYHSGDYGWEQHFTCAAHLEHYVAEVWDRKRSKSDKEREDKSQSATSSQGSASNKRKRIKKAAAKHGPRVLLGKRASQGERYAAAATDLRGVPLPVLGAPRR